MEKKKNGDCGMKQQYLKMKKHNKQQMEKRLLKIGLNIFFILATIILISNVATANQYFEYSRFLGDNATLQKFASMTYEKTDYDTIKSGNQFQFYIWYYGNAGDWITQPQYANNTLKNCNLKVQIAKGTSLLSQVDTTPINQTLITLLDQNFTENVQSGKYFVSLNPLDSAYITMNCVFINPSARPNRFDMPMDFNIVSPTYECKACQYYEWATDEVTLNKAKTLGEYTGVNLNYISRFFGMFYEIFVIGFWVLMIFILILAIALIFFGISWLFKWMSKWVK